MSDRRQREALERRSNFAFVNALREVIGLDPLVERARESFAWDGWPAFDDGNRRTSSAIDNDGRRQR